MALRPSSPSNVSAQEPRFSVGISGAAGEGIVGSIAFSRSGDLSSGTFEDAQVLKKFGDAPDDLSGL
jgi:hypothetical protein